MNVYYNENDPFTAAWLQNLQDGNCISKGKVDARSIVDVKPEECRDTSHFFAGIGGWDYALRLAGWPANRPVWTGSCPCQPFSAAGKGLGEKDPRHLWPEWFQLIRECRPPIIFGEQVEGAVSHGWLDGVFGDLEGEGYACGAVILGAHSVGAPHIRQRLYWVANAEGFPSGSGVNADWLEHPESHGREQQGTEPSGMDDTQSHGRESGAQLHPEHNGQIVGGGCKSGYWSDFDTLQCTDGKARRIKSGLEPLAHGVSGRVGRLRAYGNAIVPEVAAEFIKAFMESEVLL